MPSPEGAKGPATLTYEGTTIELPVVQPTLGRTALDISALGPTGPVRARPRLRGHGRLPLGHHVRRRGGRAPVLPGLPGRATGHVALVPRSRVPAHPRRAAQPPGGGRVHRQGAGPQAGPPRRHREALRLLPPVDAPDGHAGHRHRGLERLRRRGRQARQPGRRGASRCAPAVGHAHLHRLRPVHAPGPAPGQEQPFARLRRGPAPAVLLHPRQRPPPRQRHRPGAQHPPGARTPTTSSIARRPPCAWWRRRAPVSMPAFPPP